MQDFKINVGEIEELQTIRDTESLNRIFDKAQRTIVGGALVILERTNANGSSDKFDEISTEQDLKQYKTGVYKYL